jgi:hypothetical protein
MSQFGQIQPVSIAAQIAAKRSLVGPMIAVYEMGHRGKVAMHTEAEVATAYDSVP